MESLIGMSWYPVEKVFSRAIPAMNFHSFIRWSIKESKTQQDFQSTCQNLQSLIRNSRAAYGVAEWIAWARISSGLRSYTVWDVKLEVTSGSAVAVSSTIPSLGCNQAWVELQDFSYSRSSDFISRMHWWYFWHFSPKNLSWFRSIRFSSRYTKIFA